MLFYFTGKDVTVKELWLDYMTSQIQPYINLVKMLNTSLYV